MLIFSLSQEQPGKSLVSKHINHILANHFSFPLIRLEFRENTMDDQGIHYILTMENC